MRKSKVKSESSIKRILSACKDKSIDHIMKVNSIYANRDKSNRTETITKLRNEFKTLNPKYKAKDESVLGKGRLYSQYINIISNPFKTEIKSMQKITKLPVKSTFTENIMILGNFGTQTKKQKFHDGIISNSWKHLDFNLNFADVDKFNTRNYQYKSVFMINSIESRVELLQTRLYDSTIPEMINVIYYRVFLKTIDIDGNTRWISTPKLPYPSRQIVDNFFVHHRDFVEGFEASEGGGYYKPKTYYHAVGCEQINILWYM